ncbi:MAG: UxaA family hydrolase [Thermoguttaceae bacterium]|nr:UxaA family hydrolase [Thermoguttaceae bacterium]MDW8037607.1 UxaA family hydrolase [Thermoguttaceae bacterium]
MLTGYPRADGRKGIRNILAVAYLVECARHVAQEIAGSFRNEPVHLVGFSGCYPSPYAQRMMQRICTHPNVGAVLLVSLGCESFPREALAEAIQQSGRPVEILVIQQAGGTSRSIQQGQTWVRQTLQELRGAKRVPMGIQELVVGTICGGSDATSGLTANPACGYAFDLLLQAGATCIFEETGELIGCEHFLAQRAMNPQVAEQLIQAVQKAARYYKAYGHASFASGNAEGGLTTIEEKSLGAYSKTGRSPITGYLKPGQLPGGPGLYLMDLVPDGPPMWGFPNICDNAEIAELIACGVHLSLFTTGLGSVVGSAIAPVLKVCANPDTYRRMSEDMDINAGRILEGQATLEQVGREIYERTLAVASGQPTASERLGHQEFILTYKHFSWEVPGPVLCRQTD